MWFYINGQFCQDEEAKVPVTDRAFLYGDGCFEGIGIFQGRIPHLDDHIERLFRSARMLRIEMPVEPPRLRELILETAQRNGMREAESAYLRPLVTRGSGPLGVKNSLNLGPPTLVIIPQLSGRKALFGDEVGVCKAVISRYVRAASPSLDPGIKSNNYLTSILAFLEAREKDPEAEVAVLRDSNGFLSEGHAMNLFCIREGRLYSPMEHAALRGITRKHVLHVARSELKIETIETNLTEYDLICADEAFITSAMESVAPIASVDGQSFAGPIPGPLTSKIRAAYLEYAWSTATEVPPSA